MLTDNRLSLGLADFKPQTNNPCYFFSFICFATIGFLKISLGLPELEPQFWTIIIRVNVDTQTTSQPCQYALLNFNEWWWFSFLDFLFVFPVQKTKGQLISKWFCTLCWKLKYPAVLKILWFESNHVLFPFSPKSKSFKNSVFESDM